MEKSLITLFIISLFARTLPTKADLLDYNSTQENLDPINDQETYNTSIKDHDKRTIFKPTIQNYAWAKHVAIKPSGAKHIIGFGPVDLKYTPVLRPISIKPLGYHYDKPKIHFHLRKPTAIVQTGWKPFIKPIVAVAKPAIPVHIPTKVVFKPSKPIHEEHIHVANPVDYLHFNPVPHVDHVHKVPVPAHIDHVHASPIHVDHVQTVPLHIDHLHQHIVPHSGHVHTVAHVDHLHTLPQQVPVTGVIPQPIALPPHIPHPVIQQPVIHNPVPTLFEVTKPDLGVLPLGTVFSSPVLKEIPAPQLQPIAPAHSVAAINHVTHLHPVPSPHVQPVTHLHPVAPAPVTHLNPIHSSPHIHQVPHLHEVPQLFEGPHLHHTSHIHQVPQLQPEIHALHSPQFHHTSHVHQVPHLQPELHALHSPHLHQVPQVHQFPPSSLAHETGPGTFVEYHGSTNFINSLRGHVPAVGHVPANVPQIPELPHHYHLNFPQIAPHSNQQHNVQIPVVQNTNENIFPTQQHPPIDDRPHFQQNPVQQVFPENIPHHQGNFQPEAEFPQHDQPKFHPADQVSSQHFYQGQQEQIHGQGQHDGYAYPRPGQYIQPGETDLQLPLHLPHHPGFQGTGRQFQQEQEFEHDSRFTDTIFKPSIQLEPPYNE